MLRAVFISVLGLGLVACGDPPASPLQNAAASIPPPPPPFATLYVPRAGTDFIVPDESPVKLASIEPAVGVVHFAGQFELTGNFEIGYWDEQSRSMELGAEDLALRFIPDAATQARLPRWKAFDRNHDVDFTDTRAAIERLAGKPLLDDLLARRIASVRGTATLKVKDFDTYVECDSAHFDVKLIGVAHVDAPATGSQDFVSDADTGC